MFTPGRHGAIFGERGVGKSSLANIVLTLFFETRTFKHGYRVQCGQDTRFADIMSDALKGVAGYDVSTSQATQTASGSTKGSLGAFGTTIEGGVVSEHSVTSSRPYLTPATAATLLASTRGLLVVDEADALRDADTKRQLSELIKALSDTNAEFKVLVVGIANTVSQLVESHLSSSRALKEIHLSRMSPRGLKDIIRNGQQELGINFEPAVVDRIVRVSNGYPYFTHLLALEAAKPGILETRSHVLIPDYERATRRAAADAEATLLKKYDDAVGTGGSDGYRRVLVAAASVVSDRGELADKLTFTSRELRDEYKRLFHEPLPPQALGNHMRRLCCSEDENQREQCIFLRERRSVYRFNDLRMVSLINIKEEERSSVITI